MTQTSGGPGEPQAGQSGYSSQWGPSSQPGQSSQPEQPRQPGQSGHSGQSVTVFGYVVGGIFWLGLAVGAAATVSGERSLALMVVLALMAAAGGALLLIGCIAQGVLIAHRERPPD